jgi:hypothetical protein
MKFIKIFICLVAYTPFASAQSVSGTLNYTGELVLNPSTHMEIVYRYGLIPRSSHDVPTIDGNSIQVGYLAAKYRLNDHLSLVSSTAFINDARTDENGGEYNNNFEIGTIATYGNFEGSLTYASGIYSAAIENWHASARYAFNENLTAMVHYSELDVADYNVASVGFAYDIQQQLSITASATELANFSTRLRSYTLGVGLNF